MPNKVVAELFAQALYGAKRAPHTEKLIEYF